MSREKQIDDIRKIIANCDNVPSNVCRFKPCSLCKAERLYNAGYRKQSEGEWISVEERLPDQYEDVLGFCHYVYESGGVFDLILTMKLTTEGKFVPFNCSPLKEGIVTHWMPLPEPPDTKGGE